MPDLSLLDAESKARMTPEQIQTFADMPDSESPTAPSSPEEVVIDNSSFSKLTSEQFQTFANSFPKGTPIRVGPKPKPVPSADQPPDLDPDALRQLEPEQLFEFAKQTKWSPTMWAQTYPEHLDPDTLTKLAKTDVLLRKSGLTWSDIPLESVAMALPHMAKGAFDYGTLAFKTAVLPPGSPAQVKAKSEMEAASETASFGTADLARRAYNKVGRFLHLQKPLENYTDEDAVDLFQRELAVRNQMAKIVSGQGEATKFLGGENLRQLMETGLKLDDAAIQSASAGDPISFAAFGGGFKIFNAVTGKVVGYAASQSAALQAVKKLGVIRDSVARAEKLAEAIPSAENISAANRAIIAQGAERAAAGPLVQGLEQAAIAGEKAVKFVQEAPGVIAGRATQGLGEGIRLAAKGIQKAAPYGIIGTLAQGNIPAAIGSFVAQVTRPLIEKAGVNIANLGKAIAERGAPGGTWARAVQDLSKVPGQAIGGAAKGFPMDFGLMALSSETPEEQRESPFMATAFGAAHGLLLGGRGFAKGQLLAPRPWTPSDSWSKSYGNFPELDRAHQETMRIASPGVKQRLGALRDLAGAVGTEMYQFSGAESLAKFLESQGHTPEDARVMAENNAMFLSKLTDKNGEERKVILIRDPHAAPHEVGHPLEENLTQEQQTWFYNELLKAHGDEAVMARAKQEAYGLADASTRDELTVTPDSWKNFLLRITNNGPVAAQEKIAQHPELAGKPWDLVLTEGEKDNLVKQYALKDIGADTIGKALEHNGAGLAKDSTVLGVAARTIAKLLTFLGADPYEGETYGTQGMPIKPGALEAAQKVIQPALAEARKGKAPESKPTIPFPKVGGRGPAMPPVTPEQKSEAADKALSIAEVADEITPERVASGAQSQKEIIRIAAKHIQSGVSVRYKYQGAEGEQASTVDPDPGREQRRREIQGARNLPNALRKLADRIGVPYGVEKTKSGIQILDWSPEILASNAFRWSRALSKLRADDPVFRDPQVSAFLDAFPLDRANGEFTEQGWKNLFTEAEKFSRNQLSGFTGAGGELKFPADPAQAEQLRRAGLFEPVQTGTPEPGISQEASDFINMLYSIRPPKSPRAGKTMPRNISAQLISEATQPGRVVKPSLLPSGEERAPFAPEIEAKYGVSEIQEVNPLRAKLEKALQANGTPLPETIEVVRRLNLERIHSIEPEPAQPPIAGANLLTVQAGYQSKPGEPRAIRSAAVRDEHGKIFERSRAFQSKSTEELRDRAKDLVKRGIITKYSLPFAVEDIRPTTQQAFWLSPEGDFFRANELLRHDSWAQEFILGETGFSKLIRSLPAAVADLGPILASREAKKRGWAQIFVDNGMYVDGKINKAQKSALEDWAFEKKSTVFDRNTDRPIIEGKGEEPSAAFQSKPLTKEQAEVEDMPLLDKNQFMLTVVGPNGERYPARFDGWQENLPGKPPMAQITPKVQFPFQGDAVRSTTYDASLEQKGYKIEGLPERPTEGTVAFQPKRLQEVQDLADKYAKEKGVPYSAPEGNVQYPRETAKKLAAFYDKAQHDPENPEVKASYDAFKKETLDQFKQIQDAGYTLEPVISVESPYKNGSDVARDVEQNKHLYFNLSESAFGTPGQSEVQLMLEPSGVVLGGKEMNFNDLFRAVHDFFGHAKESFSFGPRGEFNAWREHSALFSPEAQGALATETIGQTAWTQVKPSLLNAKGELLKPGDEGFVPRAERPYAEQKNFVMPKELIDEAKQVAFQSKKKEKDTTKLQKSKTGFSKAWILPSGEIKQLGGEFHHEFLNRSPELLEKYGIPSTDSSESNRQDALAKGFARVNWEDRGGRLTVEARLKDWRKIKNRVLDIAEKNLDDIDNMSVYLYNDDVTQVVDQAHSKLFNYDDDYEKTQHLPFITEGEPGARKSLAFQSKAPAKEDFENPDTLKTALASPGWAIVTGTQEALGPWNDPANLRANKKLENELKSRGLEYITVDGEYKGKPQGDSFLVLGISPEEAHDLGVKYKQESVVVPEGLLYGDNTIVPGRTEDTKIGPEAKKEEFFSTTPGGIPFSIPFDFDKPYKPVGVQTSLFGEAELSVKDAIKKRINSKVSARKEEYPESLPLGYRKDEAGNYVLDKKTGKPIPEKQDYDFMDSALAKESGKGLRGEAREKAYVDAAGDKLIESYQDAIKDPKVKAGEKWYSTLRVRLKKLFGKQSQLVCEILAALSARTPVETNYKFGIDALNKFNRGDYDAQLKKYQEGIDNWDAGKIDDYVQNTGSTNPNRASYLNWWINTHDLKPRQSNGKLFAANSKALLRALHGSWEGGKKTRQFSQNMSGEDFNGTIDVWAARELHRVSNEGLTDRWRILPENENAVQDADFDIAQKVWRNAAEKLKVKPDTLQGILWFYTKELYKKRGWTKGAGGEKSDFSSLISETERRPTGEFRLKTPQLMMEDLVEPRY